MFINTGNLPQKELAEGVTAGVTWGEKLMLSFVKLNPNAIGPPHSHPHEQMALVLSGKIEVTIDNETRLLKEGDAFLVPPGVGIVPRIWKTRHLSSISSARREKTLNKPPYLVMLSVLRF